MDGASELTIFVRIVLPLAKPALATVGMFITLNYWNDWFLPLMYVDNSELYNLQYRLYLMMRDVQEMIRNSASSGMGIGIAMRILFQLPPPRGGRRGAGDCGGRGRDISTPAPAWGATWAMPSIAPSFKISTPAPAWGATGIVGAAALVGEISTPAPAWGATGYGFGRCDRA